MIIISTGDTSLGLQLSPSFKVMLSLFFPFFLFFFGQCAARAKRAGGKRRPRVSQNRRRVPPPVGLGFHWGAARNAERQSEVSDAAAHTLSVASGCLTKIAVGEHKKKDSAL